MTQESVFRPLLDELATGFLADNSLAAMAIRADEAVDSAQLIELCSQAKTLFNLATLVERGLDRISDHHRLWTLVHRLCELAAYRIDLFSVTKNDREVFVRRFRSDFVEDRTAKPEDSDRSEEEEKIDAFLSLPI